MNSASRWWPIAAAVLLSSGCVSVPSSPFSSTQLRPAVFTEDVGSLTQRIEFPRGVDDVSMVVNCGSVISVYGEMRALRCGQPKGDRKPFVAAIYSAYSGARVAPAMSDSKPVSVLMLFQVEFSRRDGEEVIRVLENNSWNRKRLGDDYVSAQIILEDDDSYSNALSDDYCAPEESHRVTAILTSSGEVRKFKPVGDDISEKCRDWARSRFAANRFIPAHAQGVPVQSFYEQSFFHASRVRERFPNRGRGPLAPELADPFYRRPSALPTPQSPVQQP